MYDNLTRSRPVPAVSPQAVTASGTGIIIDFADKHARTFDLQAGTLAACDGSNYLIFKLTVGDDSGLSDGVDAPADDLLTQVKGAKPNIASVAGGNIPLNAQALADQVFGRICYRGQKRYGRIDWTETGTFNGLIAAQCHTSELPNNPSAL